MKEENNWKSIWGKRLVNEEILQSGNPQKIFLELKRCNGYDVVGEGLPYESFIKQKEELLQTLSLGLTGSSKISSLFEVGCGSGANLYLYEQDGISCGGIDYSQNLIACAKQVLNTKDIFCAEASALPVNPKYDAVISMGVFPYFDSEQYAEAVLEKMAQKAIYSLSVYDIPDLEKADKYLSYRRAVIPNYDEKYKSLSKHFYRKSFFQNFAKKHNMDILIRPMNLDGYWNQEFTFNCYMYNRERK